MKKNKTKMVSLEDIFPGISEFEKGNKKYKKVEAHFEIINTMSLINKYRIAGEKFPIQEQIDALHQLAEELKVINRSRIYDVKNTKKVDERLDEIGMK